MSSRTNWQASMSQLSEVASVTPPPAASAPPLASFDAAGTASVISYQTPEPTSYGGRHVLEITDYTLQDFADVIAPADQKSAEQGASSAVPGTAATAGTSLAGSVSAPRAVV